MRIRITFNVNNRGGLVPFHHQYLISEVIRNILEEDNSDEFRNYPFYSFSGLKGQTRLSRNGLRYNSKKVTIVVSSVSEPFISHLVGLLLKQDAIQIADLNITPELAEEEVSVGLDGEAKFLCISPLVVISPEDDPASAKEFIDPTSDTFSDYLFEATINRMTSYGIDVDSIPNIQKFQLVPDKEYLNKLKSSNKKFARIYPMYKHGEKLEVRGYTFPFTLFAAPEVQAFVYTCGLGSMCCKGFGMLDIANSNPVERTVPFMKKSELVSA
ncbi:CRISPR-associated endoribonuclease Cas6 [Marinoscillum pacificum]|uniref:CRISPR-associated endoribonuclease Cas6 n=1 Tax=Marinoscillum pacificum TaxID=392723 RepID=UPI0021570C37|nr:CRISPR-associated endoribonuclease Cas6 [Marinoscillum pacificum]